MTRSEIRKTFLKVAERWEQLERFKLIYQYTPIRTTEIRLVYINPAPKFDNDLFVSIKAIGDADVGPEPLQEYEALSYHWGPGPADRPVFMAEPEKIPKIDIGDLLKLKLFVPDYLKGPRLYVRPNLDKALRYLRRKTETVILWVDAICINQPDEKKEKPTQIAKMTQIYYNAENVCIWLGDGKAEGNEDRTQDFHRAIQFSREILDLQNLELLSKDERKTKNWSDLLDLMRCSWFSRRWVIQELALARKATVHCGEAYVHWQDFSDAIGLFVVNYDRVRELFRRSSERAIVSNYENFSELEPLGAKVLVDAITNTFRKSIDNTLFEPVSDLETLVSSLSTFESSDPRDTIFALLNIARESLLPFTPSEDVVHPPKPDYAKNLLEVYTDFMEWVVHSSSSLDIICRQWAIPERTKPGGRKNPTAIVKLPSWIQTISKSTWGTQEQGFNGRLNGDSLVGPAGRRRYNASWGRKPEVRFGLRWRHAQQLVNRINSAPMKIRARAATVSGQNDASEMSTKKTDIKTTASEATDSVETSAHRLRVKGVQIDTVGWISAPISKGIIHKECLKKGGLVGDNQEIFVKAPDKLWRTLVADRNAEGKNPPPLYHRAALHCLARADNNGNIDTRDFLHQGFSAKDRIPPIVVEYLKRVQAVTWNRKFLEGTAQDKDQEPLFGLGPPETEQGDRICILFGCSVPCILRPRKRSGGQECFEFVGEAYVYGRMDGEAITQFSTEELTSKTTEFVIM